MNCYLFKVTAAVMLVFASMVPSANAGAKQYLIFKALNVSQNCLGSLTQVSFEAPLQTQAALFSCSAIAYLDSDTLVYDDATNVCMTYADFAATTTMDIDDTYIPYTSTKGMLQNILEDIFKSDKNAVLTFGPLTGQVSQGESTICAAGLPLPSPNAIFEDGFE